MMARASWIRPEPSSAQGRQQLEEKQAQLNAGQAEIQANTEKLTSSQAELDANEQKLLDGEKRDPGK